MGINARGLYATASDAEDPIYARGFWYPMGASFTAAGTIIPANSIRLVPFRIRQFVNIVSLGARITTLAAGGNLQVGIYAANPNTLLPTGPVLARSASQVTDAAGLFPFPLLNAAGISLPFVQLPRGIYWFGVMADATAGGVVIMQTEGTANMALANLVGAAAQATANAGSATSTILRTFAATFGTWPDLTGQTTAEGSNLTCATGMFQVQA